MRLIDADALIEVLGIAENCSDCQYQNGPLCDKNDCFVDACEAIFDMPTIDPVKHGRWIGIDDYPYETWECDQCGCIYEEMPSWTPNYCPNCGARMDVPDNDVGETGGEEG